MFLSVQNVFKSYGKEMVLKGVSFEIDEPKIVALVGPNGSGKSTLLNIISNLLSADSGEVTVLGKSNKDPNIFKEVSFMQDNSILYDYLTGYDHLQFIGDVQGISKERLLETAERIGITGYLHKKVGKYSLGMKQHLLLAMAVVNHPKLLILDEPLNGLDPTSAIKVRNLLLDIKAEGTAILLSSHNLAEIDRVTSEILFLKTGTLMKEDISQLEQSYYLFSVHSIEKAQQILQNHNLTAVIEDEKLKISNVDLTLREIIQLLEQEGVILLDIEKVTRGSEARYQEIFSIESRGSS